MCGCERHGDRFATCTCTCDHGMHTRALLHPAPEPEPPSLYTDTERNYLLTVWDDGDMTLAFRDEYRRWLPPIRLTPERTDLTPPEQAAVDAVEVARLARLEAGLGRWL